MGKLETPKEHKFWNTQPVLALDQEVTENGPINDTMTVDQVRAVSILILSQNELTMELFFRSHTICLKDLLGVRLMLLTLLK